MPTLALPEGIDAEVVVTRRVRKTIGIRIADGRIELAAHPRVPLATLQRVLDDKRDWIRAHWQRQQAVHVRRSAPPGQLLLQGRVLSLQHDPCGPATVRQEGDTLWVGGQPSAVREQVAHFLFCQAAEQFPRQWRRLAPLAAREPGPLLLSSARTRWGSCHQDGRIRLNWRLIQAPADILDYVIAHELAHLRHMNHSPAFWQETGRLFPAWREARSWLRQYGEQLFDFG
ncbi:M48 family metallopeptidase [Paludibacterium sp. B53371]|uniref:M48 family metallopeptidase n=1 Tax=Paludibacterium sp. B53371 TaxID=2806263 RepID=UPI001C058D04|nr:SprT family zinc-dependent metalloprotease [Paludibacterium sp. B53371]